MQDWRWVYWILAIFAGVCTIILITTVPETYAPRLLVQKSRQLRKETGDRRWYAPRRSSIFLVVAVTDVNASRQGQAHLGVSH